MAARQHQPADKSVYLVTAIAPVRLAGKAVEEAVDDFLRWSVRDFIRFSGAAHGLLTRLQQPRRTSVKELLPEQAGHYERRPKAFAAQQSGSLNIEELQQTIAVSKAKELSGVVETEVLGQITELFRLLGRMLHVAIQLRSDVDETTGWLTPSLAGDGGPGFQSPPACLLAPWASAGWESV